MAFYIKVTKEVADRLHLNSRNKIVVSFIC